MSVKAAKSYTFVGMQPDSQSHSANHLEEIRGKKIELKLVY